MAQTLTPNFQLNKYDQGDNPGAAALNANWDTIDEVLGEAAGAVALLETAGFLTLAVEAGLPASKRLQGTENQVIATVAAGDLVLSLPQNIHAAATPQFAGATFTGSLAFSGDNTHDLTAVGARPRDVYAGRQFLGPTGTAAAPAYSSTVSGGASGLYFSGHSMAYSSNGTPTVVFCWNATSEVTLSSTGQFGWSSGNPSVSAPDLILSRVSAGVGKVTNAALACEWRVHGDAAKYTSVSHDGTNAFVTASSGTLLLFSAAAYIGWDGTQLFPSTDNGQALGKTTNRYSIGYFGTSVSVGTSPSTTGAVRIAYGASTIMSRNSTNGGDIELLDVITVNSVTNIARLAGSGSNGVHIKARSAGAAPSTSDLPDGFFTVWRDTVGATTKLYYNNAGAIQSVALA